LFEEKDEEISKLTAEVSNLKINAHLKNNEYTNEINKIK
jgi:predicted transcriptional regulator